MITEASDKKFTSKYGDIMKSNSSDFSNIYGYERCYVIRGLRRGFCYKYGVYIFLKVNYFRFFASRGENGTRNRYLKCEIRPLNQQGSG